jgi:hypothetical protein
MKRFGRTEREIATVMTEVRARYDAVRAGKAPPAWTSPSERRALAETSPWLRSLFRHDPQAQVDARFLDDVAAFLSTSLASNVAACDEYVQKTTVIPSCAASDDARRPPIVPPGPSFAVASSGPVASRRSTGAAVDILLNIVIAPLLYSPKRRRSHDRDPAPSGDGFLARSSRQRQRCAVGTLPSTCSTCMPQPA